MSAWLAPVAHRADLPACAAEGAVCLVTDELGYEGYWFVALLVGGTIKWLPVQPSPRGNVMDYARPLPATIVRRPVECGHCGASVPPTAERCPYCGAWFGETEEAE